MASAFSQCVRRAAPPVYSAGRSGLNMPVERDLLLLLLLLSFKIELSLDSGNRRDYRMAFTA